MRKKQPLNLDVLNDMLEKMHVDFDDQGNPRLPTLLVPPEMVETVKNLVPTDAQLVRRQQILDSKRKEHDDKKRSRRLS